MNIQTTFPEYPIKIKLGDNLIFLGSCFANEMTSYFEDIGLYVLKNPFGVLFHPMVVARNIMAAINDKSDVETVKRGDIYFSWDCSGEIWSLNEKELIEKVQQSRSALKKALGKKNAKLFVTFGTSFLYRLNTTDRYVANCHKQPIIDFKKELSAVEELINHWEFVLDELKSFNPDLSVFVSVSPVRHIKDGLHENHRSKGRLMELVSDMSARGAFYIPAYELIIDELRDYRYYDLDMVHPNQVARDILWNRLEHTLLDSADRRAFTAIFKYHQELKHRSLYTGSLEDEKRLKKLIAKRNELVKQYPHSVLK